MSCYHPLKGFIIGINSNGKKDLKITPYDTECVYQASPNSSWEKHGYVLDRNIVKGRVVTDFVQIPCGQCIGCRLDYSRQWAIRCMLEAQQYDENYFITLTYNDNTVPYSEYIDDDGVINTSMTLVKSDLQKFFKRVRSDLDYRGLPSFRYFACGEYGSLSARPHYHMIAFNLHLNDLVKYKDTDYGTLYTSDYLSSKWKHGYVIIGSVTFESCSYVSRYIVKKQKGKNADVYSRFNITPEFVCSSRHPGIARNYFENTCNSIYNSDSLVLPGGIVVKPPRYFDNLMDDIDEDLMSGIRLARTDTALALQEQKKYITDANYINQLENAERNKLSQINRLVRSL